MKDKVIKLPDAYFSKEDEQRLESFGAHLIAHGKATRWRWVRKNGIDVAFNVYRGGPDEVLMFSFSRDREREGERGYYLLTDATGRTLEKGKLERLMFTADLLATPDPGDAPA